MLIWLIVAVLAAIGEVLTTGLFLACVALAAVITAVLSLVVPFEAVQILVFAALSLGSILVIRPIVVNAIGLDALVHRGGDISQTRLVGRRAIVMHPVSAHEGQIRIGQGEFWTARRYSGEDIIPIGQPVEILHIDGITALVEPMDSPSITDDIDAALSSTKGDSR